MFWIVTVSAFDYRGALQRAQASAGLKDEAVACLLGVSRQRYAQLRDSGGSFTMERLAAIAVDPDGFVMVQHFLAEWATYHGIESLDLAVQMVKDAIRMVTARQIDLGRARMAKAQLPERAEGRRTA